MAWFNFFNFPQRNIPRDEEVEDQTNSDPAEEVSLSIAALNNAHRAAILQWMERLRREHRLRGFYTSLSRVPEIRRRQFLRNLAEANDRERRLLMFGLHSPRFMQAYETVQGLGRGPASLVGFCVLSPIAAVSGSWWMAALLLAIAPAVVVLLGCIIAWMYVNGEAGGLIATFTVAALLTLLGAMTIFLVHRHKTRDERELREERREDRRRQRQHQALATATPTPEQPHLAQPQPVQPQPTARSVSQTSSSGGLVVVLLILAALAVAIWAIGNIEVEKPEMGRAEAPRKVVVAGIGTSHLPVGVVRQDPGAEPVVWNTAACIGSVDGHGCSRENKWGALRRFAPGMQSCTTRTAVYVEPNGHVSKIFTAGSSGNAGCDRAQEYWMSRTVWDRTGWIGYNTTINL